MMNYIYACPSCDHQITVVGEGQHVALVKLECNLCDEELKLVDMEKRDLTF